MWIVGDGFDYYNTSADIARSVWDSVIAVPNINDPNSGIPPRFLPGQAINVFSAATVCVKNFANATTLFVVFAAYRPGGLTGLTAELFFKFFDGATPQVTIVMQSNGDMLLKRGDETGTVVATYPAAFVQDVWTHFQCRVVIDPAAGTFTVRKNGVPTDSFSAGGLNTRVTANSFANSFAFGNQSFVAWRLDDILLFSGAGAAPNTWVGDVRAICLPAAIDTAQKNFTFAPSDTVVVGDTAVFTDVIPANEIHWGGVAPAGVATVVQTGALYPSRSGAVVKVTANATAAVTGHVKMAIYVNDAPAGGPGTLLAVSNEVTNPPTGVVDFTFPAGTYMSSHLGYFFAFLTDVAWTIGTIGSVTGHWALSRTYASGFPSPAPTSLPADPDRAPQARATLSGNAVCVSERTASGDTDFVYSSIVNDLDLYDMGNLPTTPAAIIAVVSKLYVRKSDAGTRNGAVAVRSGATDVLGADTPLSTTYTYISRVDTTDPATAVAWTLGGVNAVKVGPKVTL
jgi:hypothetical protein